MLSVVLLSISLSILLSLVLLRKIFGGAPNSSADSNRGPNSCVSALHLEGPSKCDVVVINDKNEIRLPEGLEAELMPKHVAVIMDGNRRWAKSRELPVHLGHIAGGRALKQLTANCIKYGVQVLTVYAFSTENWNRPKEEVDFLMKLSEEVIKSEIEEVIRNDVRVSVMGDVNKLPESLQKLIYSSQERSKASKGLHLVVAINYGGRYDITQATKKIAQKIKDGVIKVEDINDTLFEQHLETNVVQFPNPDLLIRTSGELRVSNFLLWQLAYTELLFVDKMFPDFDDADLVEALSAFQRRQRRYGGHKY